MLGFRIIFVLYCRRPTPGGCCAAAEQRVEDCYKQNPGRILLCSKLVSEYDRCVQNFLVVSNTYLNNFVTSRFCCFFKH